MQLQNQAPGTCDRRPASAAGAVDAAGLAGAAVALLGGQPGGALGGLGALLVAFERAALGDVFRSWVATGSNQPITAAELERVLGTEVIGRLASSAGVDPWRTVAGLAELLPRVVDQLTPGGVLPAGGGEPAGLARRLLGC